MRSSTAPKALASVNEGMREKSVSVSVRTLQRGALCAGLFASGLSRLDGIQERDYHGFDLAQLSG